MNSIKRLVNLAGSDPGFYILALQSYIEKYLKEHSPAGYEEYGFADFAANIRHLKDFLVSQQQGFNPDLKYLTEIAKEHYITNQVRHEFSAFSPAEASTATHRFLGFCRVMEIPENDALQELEKLENKTFKQFSENRDLQAHIEEWQEKVREYDSLKLEKKSLSAQIMHLESRDEKLSDKNQRLRNERFALSQKLKDKEKTLNGYESAREYTENLKRMVSYTWTRMDYERTIIRLTPEQKEVLSRISLKGDYLIKGAAGTGKTYLLLEAMKKAVKNRKESLQLEEESRLTLLSYTKTLVKYNRYISHIMGIDRFLLPKKGMEIWLL